MLALIQIGASLIDYDRVLTKLQFCGWTANPVENVDPLENDIDIVGVDLEAKFKHEAIDVHQDSLRHEVTIIDKEASISTARHIFYHFLKHLLSLTNLMKFSSID